MYRRKRAQREATSDNGVLVTQRRRYQPLPSPRRISLKTEKHNHNKSTLTMTDMYRKPRVPEVSLTPYEHNERGSEVRTTHQDFNCFGEKLKEYAGSVHCDVVG